MIEEKKVIQIAPDQKLTLPPIGSKWREYNKYLYHIQGFVDDQIVMRYWRPHKQRWEYVCTPQWLFEYQVTSGTMVREKK